MLRVRLTRARVISEMGTGQPQRGDQAQRAHGRQPGTARGGRRRSADGAKPSTTRPATRNGSMCWVGENNRERSSRRDREAQRQRLVRFVATQVQETRPRPPRARSRPASRPGARCWPDSAPARRRGRDGRRGAPGSRARQPPDGERDAGDHAHRQQRQHGSTRTAWSGSCPSQPTMATATRPAARTTEAAAVSDRGPGQEQRDPGDDRTPSTSGPGRPRRPAGRANGESANPSTAPRAWRQRTAPAASSSTDEPRRPPGRQQQPDDRAQCRAGTSTLLARKASRAGRPGAIARRASAPGGHPRAPRRSRRRRAVFTPPAASTLSSTASRTSSTRAGRTSSLLSAQLEDVTVEDAGVGQRLGSGQARGRRAGPSVQRVGAPPAGPGRRSARTWGSTSESGSALGRARSISAQR